jgi:hypothetical protein
MSVNPDIQPAIYEAPDLIEADEPRPAVTKRLEGYIRGQARIYRVMRTPRARLVAAILESAADDVAQCGSPDDPATFLDRAAAVMGAVSLADAYESMTL